MALKEENSNISNEDIRDRVMKDCISIWQKDTIRNALPDEYKDKQKQEAARISHKNRNKSGESTVFAEPSTDAGLNTTETFSSEPTEQHSRTFNISETEVISQFKDLLDSKDRKLKEVIQENAMLRHYKNTPNEHMIRGYNARVSKINYVISKAVKEKLDKEGQIYLRFNIADKDNYLTPVLLCIDFFKGKAFVSLDKNSFEAD
ncbi:MAG: hypothetical protein QN720_12545 [Nitrososphaeraceae archaeon]|nr:hypothetical protein [Nitrososphaeraceae archaeon]MDW0333773.1 hypothetical protein [Nitrososphaeraceae archaeon]